MSICNVMSLADVTTFRIAGVCTGALDRLTA
jgi:hypothetical protein